MTPTPALALTQAQPSSLHGKPASPPAPQCAPFSTPSPRTSSQDPPPGVLSAQFSWPSSPPRMKSKLLLSDHLPNPTASRPLNSAGAPSPCKPDRRGGWPPPAVPAPGVYLEVGVVGLGLGLRAAAAVAPPAPAGGRRGGCRARAAAAAAQLGASPAAPGVGLHREAGQGRCGARRQAGAMVGRVGLVRVPTVDHAALRNVDAGGAAHPLAGLPRAPGPGAPAATCSEGAGASAAVAAPGLRAPWPVWPPLRRAHRSVPSQASGGPRASPQLSLLGHLPP